MIMGMEGKLYGKHTLERDMKAKTKCPRSMQADLGYDLKRPSMGMSEKAREGTQFTLK